MKKIKRKLNIDIIRDEINSNNDYILLSSDYKNQKTKLSIKHILCGNTFTIDYDHWHNRGQRCPYCNRYSQKHSTEEFKELLHEKAGNKYTVLSQYINKRTKVKVKCNDCGSIFESLPNSLYNSRCKTCGNKILHYKNLNKVEDIKLPEGYVMAHPENYQGMKIPMEIIHTVCNKSFIMKLSNLTDGGRCPHCYTSSSKGEQEVFDFVSQFYQCKKEKFYIDRSKHKFYELDVYIPDLKIGFEYDGLYWHSERKVDRYYHLNKTNFFKELGIQIYHIFSDDWEYKKDIVKNDIKSVLKLNETLKADNYTIQSIPKETAIEFLINNSVRSIHEFDVSVGLFCESKLLGVVTFKYSNGQYIANNYSMILGYNTDDWLLKIISEYCQEAVYISDNIHWPLFKDYNLTISGITEPNCYYIDNNFTLRESYISDEYPNKIYDCGAVTYKLTMKER